MSGYRDILPAATPAPVEEFIEAADVRIERAQQVAHEAVVHPAVARRRSRRFLTVALTLLVGYLALLLAIRARPDSRTDRVVTVRLQRMDGRRMQRLMHATSWLGFRPQSLLLPMTAIGSAWVLRFRVEALFLAGAWASSLISFLSKLVVRRPRPSGPLIRVVTADIRDTSFPSGHTVHYVTFWGFVTYLIFTLAESPLLRWGAVAVAAPVIALVGVSRVYLGHHWLSDVVASYLLGFAYLIGLVSLYQRVMERARQRPAGARGRRRA